MGTNTLPPEVSHVPELQSWAARAKVRDKKKKKNIENMKMRFTNITVSSDYGIRQGMQIKNQIMSIYRL